MLYIGIVLRNRTKKERQKELNSLPSSIKGTFHETIKRIEDLGKSKICITNIITWIHLAEQPLIVDELLYTLAIEEEEDNLDKENLNN